MKKVAPMEIKDDAQEISVFDYEDYHAFLKDWSDAKRKQRSSFSFQELANRAGLKSRSFLRKVSLGQKQLLHGAAVQLCEAMELPERESNFFLALVGFNNADRPKERDLYLRKMRKIKRPAKRRILSAQEFDFFEKWYIVVVWELVTYLPFGGDFQLLGKSINPPISPDAARHALIVLLDLGLIEPFEDKYKQTDKVLHTRDELISKAITSYQKETILLAEKAIDSISASHRHISTLTMGLDERRWQVAMTLIKDFRQQLIDLATEPAVSDSVYQFNIQAFPFTKI